MTLFLGSVVGRHCFNKEILDFEYEKNSSLSTLIDKDEKIIIIKKIKDLNGMEITFNVINKKN